MVDIGWTFPLQHENDEPAHVWRLAMNLIDEGDPGMLTPHDALRLAVELYAAQKVARSIEMVEVQLNRIREELSRIASAQENSHDHTCPHLS